MAYFPLFKALDCDGFINLANFSPNNKERAVVGDMHVYAIRTDGETWYTEYKGIVQEGSFKSFQTDDFDLNDSEVVLFKITPKRLNEKFNALPPDNFISTVTPEWRATVGLKRSGAQTSYQGEINPFPPKASLLTFHPFIQFYNTENFLIFLNIESSPVFRWADLDVFNSITKERITTIKVRNNCANVIPLDGFDFTETDLPIFICASMAGIPFGFGRSTNSPNLSLEHTHPPGSLTIFGNRLNSQKHTKIQWNDYLTARDV